MLQKSGKFVKGCRPEALALDLKQNVHSGDLVLWYRVLHKADDARLLLERAQHVIDIDEVHLVQALGDLVEPSPESLGYRACIGDEYLEDGLSGHRYLHSLPPRTMRLTDRSVNLPK